MQCIPLNLPGLFHVRLDERRDERGAFTRLFCAQALQGAGVHRPIAQINHSVTRTRGTVRGLHYQTGAAAETKVIRCLRGSVWDVAVDLRPDSPTYLRWQAVTLRADEPALVVIPPGCAHGFQALTDDAELLYAHTAPYTPDAEGGVHIFDEHLAIAWPLAVTCQSARDQSLPRVDAAVPFIHP
jgi:dTDP-4-dehydrorhamnose 3,5-epimerase